MNSPGKLLLYLDYVLKNSDKGVVNVFNVYTVPSLLSKQPLYAALNAFNLIAFGNSIF